LPWGRGWLWGALLSLWIIALARCSSPVTGDGLVFCEGAQDCPKGAECSMNVCIKTPYFRLGAEAPAMAEVTQETPDSSEPAPDAAGEPPTPESSAPEGQLEPWPDEPTASEPWSDEPTAPEPRPDDAGAEPPRPDASPGPEGETPPEPPAADDAPDGPPADAMPDGRPADVIPETRPEPSTPARVTQDLIALYLFDRKSGNKVPDVSGFGSKLDLTIKGSGSHYRWLSSWGGLSITKKVVIVHSKPTKIHDEIIKRNAFTVEIWCKPGNLTQDGPARMVSLSKSISSRNFTIGQEKAGIELRLRASDSGGKNNGEPHTIITQVVDRTARQYVATFNGQRMLLYRDGKLLRSFSRKANIKNWDKSHQLVVANEVSGDRTWLGEIYLVAIYRKALSAYEVNLNYRVGYR